MLILSFISFADLVSISKLHGLFSNFIPVLLLINCKGKLTKIQLFHLTYIVFILIPILYFNVTTVSNANAQGIWSTDETKLVVAEQIRRQVNGISPVLFDWYITK
jgi:hypothetical protein